MHYTQSLFNYLHYIKLDYKCNYLQKFGDLDLNHINGKLTLADKMGDHLPVLKKKHNYLIRSRLYNTVSHSGPLS